VTELHPQVVSLIAETGDDDGPVDLAAARAGYLQTALERGGALEEVARVEEILIPRGDARIPATAYFPHAAADPQGAVVWLHGGGWCWGDVPGFDRVSRSLANRCGHVVVCVEYRLAPEHPFPAAVEDADAAVAFAAERWQGRIVVGGDSAGGNLAAVAALHAPERVRAQLLVYPATDPSRESPSYREPAPMLSAEAMAWCWERYLGGADPSHPDANLLAADVAAAPPAFVAVAGHDPLRDDGLRYAERLRAGAVAVTVERYDDMVHGFLRMGGVFDRSAELIGSLGDFARAALQD
jgi:acetyl esterase